MAKHRVKHSGVAEEFGDQTIIVPALTTGQMEKYSTLLVEHDAIDITSGFSAIAARVKLRARVIAEAVRRNYPEFTDEQAFEFVTGENSDRLLSVVLGMDRQSPRVRETGED
jgi:hypothetical protein